MATSVATLFQNHRLYPQFIQVKSILHAHDFVCWVAGGAVRDLLLDRECDDFDLVTDASTAVLKLLFPEALLFGEKFGVLKLPLEDGGFFDLTTFREEADYTDGRRPSAVSASTPVKDAFRRDFTINALFWDDARQKIWDYVGGVFDLQSARIVAVGSAEVRFQEDHLRIPRLVRFAAQLQFAVEEDTLRAARDQVPLVLKVSGERIWAELKKINGFEAWNFALGLGLFSKILHQIFGRAPARDLRLVPSRREADAAAHLFFVLSSLTSQSSLATSGFKDQLVRRLHLSKDEQNQFDLFLKLRNQFQDYAPSRLALEMEKRPLLEAVVQYFVHQRAFNADVLHVAEEMLKLYPHAFVTGEDLKGLIDVRQIGMALNEIRIQQLEGLIQSRTEALQHLQISSKKPSLRE